MLKPHSGLSQPRKARFFAEQKMRPNEAMNESPIYINNLQVEALYTHTAAKRRKLWRMYGVAWHKDDGKVKGKANQPG
jgi:hypothetical protein